MLYFCCHYQNPSFPSFQMCLLLKGLFPLVYALCEEKLDCHYFALEGE